MKATIVEKAWARSSGLKEPAEGSPEATAIEKVLQFDRRHQRELAVLLDSTGAPLSEVEGHAHGVSLGEVLVPNRGRIRGGKVIHNHPKGYGLSPDDLGLAGSWGLEIWSADNEGGLYQSRGTRGGVNPFALMLGFDPWTWELDHVRGLLGGPVLKWLESRKGGFESPEEEEMVLASIHLTNLRASRSGVLHSYEWRLGPTIRRGVERLIELAGRGKLEEAVEGGLEDDN